MSVAFHLGLTAAVAQTQPEDKSAVLEFTASSGTVLPYRKDTKWWLRYTDKKQPVLDPNIHYFEEKQRDRDTIWLTGHGSYAGYQTRLPIKGGDASVRWPNTTRWAQYYSLEKPSR